MPRKKEPQTLEELYAEKEKTEVEIRKLEQRARILKNQQNVLTRKARTHRLCTRGGMLEAFLPSPELIEDEKVMEILKVAFHQEETKDEVEKARRECERRGSLME